MTNLTFSHIFIKIFTEVRWCHLVSFRVFRCSSMRIVKENCETSRGYFQTSLSPLNGERGREPSLGIVPTWDITFNLYCCTSSLNSGGLQTEHGRGWVKSDSVVCHVAAQSIVVYGCEDEEEGDHQDGRHRCGLLFCICGILGFL